MAATTGENQAILRMAIPATFGALGLTVGGLAGVVIPESSWVRISGIGIATFGLLTSLGGVGISAVNAETQEAFKSRVHRWVIGSAIFSLMFSVAAGMIYVIVARPVDDGQVE